MLQCMSRCDRWWFTGSIPYCWCTRRLCLDRVSWFLEAKEVCILFNRLNVLGLLLFCLGYLKLKIADFHSSGMSYACLWMRWDWRACCRFFLIGFTYQSPNPLKPSANCRIVSTCCIIAVLFLMKHFIDSSDFLMPQLHLYTLAYLVITFILSYLMYHYFEKPIMKLREIKPKLRTHCQCGGNQVRLMRFCNFSIRQGFDFSSQGIFLRNNEAARNLERFLTCIWTFCEWSISNLTIKQP
jgi:hypothetical protein